jgi:hypothetical protein
MADVFRCRQYDQLVQREEDHEGRLAQDEDKFVDGCRRATYTVVLAALGSFVLALWHWGEASVFNFIFVIFGSATSMFPAVLYDIAVQAKAEHR